MGSLDGLQDTSQVRWTGSKRLHATAVSLSDRALPSIHAGDFNISGDGQFNPVLTMTLPTPSVVQRFVGNHSEVAFKVWFHSTSPILPAVMDPHSAWTITFDVGSLLSNAVDSSISQLVSSSRYLRYYRFVVRGIIKAVANVRLTLGLSLLGSLANDDQVNIFIDEDITPEGVVITEEEVETAEDRIRSIIRQELLVMQSETSSNCSFERF